MGKYFIQQYKSVLYELNNKKTELKDISDDNEVLENENKLLTSEIVSNLKSLFNCVLYKLYMLILIKYLQDTLKAKINLSNEKVVSI